MMKAWEKNIRKVVPYVPGEQPNKERMIKLNTNENPYPPAPGVAEALKNLDPDRLRLYPDPACSRLVDAIAKQKGLKPEQIFVGVGSDDVLAMCFMTFFNSEKPILFPDITYSFYDVWAEEFRIPYETQPLDDDFNIRKEDYYKENGGVIFPNPNAPTGVEASQEMIEDILQHNQDVIVIIDEAYVDFGARTAQPLLEKYDNLIVVQTFSKSRSMAGMRIGYAMASPELIKYLAPVLIPSGIHTRMLHAEFGEAAKVVVIGPCIAEKEKNRVVKPDAVLTFEDLKQWLSEEQIEIEACEEEPFEDREPGANLRYPVSGGLLTAVTATQKKPDKYRKFYVSGVKDCLDVCEAMKTGEVAGCFIEMNACHGGCVNGPSTATSVSSFKVKLDLEAMLPKEPADLSLMHEAARQVEIHRTFVDRSQKERIPTEEEIREILKKTGKMTPEQELNCGACGYPTCREKAIAVFQKKAEVDMCIPYLHDRAQSLSHLVMDTSPNLIMIIDDDMRIRECSVAAEMYFGVKPEAIKGKPLEDFINAEDVREVFRTHTSVHSRKVIYPDRNLVTLQNIAYIDDGNFVIATIIDVTREEKQAKQEYAKKKATIDLAQNVIYKQMMVAQNIAGLLGETTAETKTTLMKLCSLIDDESESEVR